MARITATHSSIPEVYILICVEKNSITICVYTIMLYIYMHSEYLNYHLTHVNIIACIYLYPDKRYLYLDGKNSNCRLRHEEERTLPRYACEGSPCMYSVKLFTPYRARCKDIPDIYTNVHVLLRISPSPPGFHKF